MADRKQSSEFLGGGPKFNAVGRDNRSQTEEEPVVPPTGRAGYRLRFAIVAVVVLLLAAAVFYMSDTGLGRATAPQTRGGSAVSPQSDKVAPPSNF